MAPKLHRPATRTWVVAALLVLLTVAVYAGGGPQHLGLQLGGEAGGHAGGPSTEAAATPPEPDTANPEPGRSTDLPAVVLAYRKFWAVAQTVDREPPEQWRPILAQVAGEPLLDELLDGLAAARASGTLQYGTVTTRPTVVDLTTDRASIIDCQDASSSGELDRTTGTIQKVGSARTPVAAVMTRDHTGRWITTEARYLPEPC